MSEPAKARSLAGYLRAIISAVDEGDPVAGERLRTLAAGRTAQIRLDDEVVIVRFAGRALQLEPDVQGAERAQDAGAGVDGVGGVDGVDGVGVDGVDGVGGTDSGTVLELLDGRTDPLTAILAGRLHLLGPVSAVVAMIDIIETVIDTAPRVPALQGLAAELRAGATGRPAPRGPRGVQQAQPAWYPHEIPTAEIALLRRSDLLRDRGD